MIIEKIKKIDWVYLVKRKEALLFQSLTTNAFKYFFKVTKLPWQCENRLQLSRGEIFHSVKGIKKLSSILAKGELKTFDLFRRNLIYYVKKLDRFAKRIEKINWLEKNKESYRNI